jgi:hypothetical protein
VLKGIKMTVRKLTEQEPALGHHLAVTVRTGVLCSYNPDPRVVAAWEVLGV